MGFFLQKTAGENLFIINNIGKWVFVDNILATLNFISLNRMNDDIRYKGCDYSGLTRYKDLDISKDYKIVAHATEIEYRVHSINDIARFTQLILQVVV